MRVSELTEELTPMFYHGTTRRAWNDWGDYDSEFVLFLASSRVDAETRAIEQYDREIFAHENDGEAEPSEPIVVEFPLGALAPLREFGARFEPDWTWVHSNKVRGRPTWEDSVYACGCFCIRDFDEAWKRVGRVTPVF